MKMFYWSIFIALFLVHFTKQDSILCYADPEYTTVVSCPFACIQKTIIEKLRRGASYHNNYKIRMGCDVLSVFENVRHMKCNEDEKQSSNYSFEYSLRDTMSNSRIFVEKKCCFTSLCNRFELTDNLELIKGDNSFWSKMNSIFLDGVLLSLTIFAMITVISLHFITSVLEKMRSKSTIEHSDYYAFIDPTIKAISEFKFSMVHDTGIHITGLLNVAQTAEVLSYLPDDEKENRNSNSSKSKSKSSEDSVIPVSVLAPVQKSESLLNITQAKTRKVHIKNPLMAHAFGMGHKLLVTNRTTTSPFCLLYRLIEHGPYQYPFTPLELLQLFEETAYKFAEEPSLLKIDAGITVIADIRGRYTDLHRWLQLTGWPPRNRILFLGGIIHNDEPGSIECLALICSLKCRFPKHVYVLRGVPETTPFRMAQRFHPKISRAIQSCISRMCSQIPFAAIIGKSVLAVYSGFSPMVRDKSNVANLYRPAPMGALTGVEKHIIFNNPSCKVRMYRPNDQSKGDLYGKEAVERTCKTLGVNLIIRGHNTVRFGYLPCWKHRLINLWSATAFGSEYGAVLNISTDLDITPILMHSNSYFSESSSSSVNE